MYHKENESGGREAVDQVTDVLSYCLGLWLVGKIRSQIWFVVKKIKVAAQEPSYCVWASRSQTWVGMCQKLGKVSV